MKKCLFMVSLIISFIIYIPYTFATDSNMMQEATNTIRNVVGGTENIMGDVANNISSTSKNVTEGIQQGLNNTMDNNNQNNTNNNGNNMGDDKNTTTGYSTDNAENNRYNPGNYMAQRTSTTTDGTIAGMNSTTWIWLILAVLAIAIIALVYYYSAGLATHNYHNDDE